MNGTISGASGFKRWISESAHSLEKARMQMQAGKTYGFADSRPARNVYFGIAG
jgi:hypothetical protein